MKKTLVRVIILMLSVSLILSLCACKMEESYKEFNFKNITDYLDEDYFTSENFDFATIEEIVFIPEIKAMNHEDYIIYVTAYSQNGNEKVLIKNVTVKEEDRLRLKRQLNKEMDFEENTDSIYKGSIDAGTFTEKDIKVDDGKEYTFIVEAEVSKNGETVAESITYEMTIIGYLSPVAPV